MRLRPPIDINEAVVERHLERTPRGEIVADEVISTLAKAVQATRLNSDALVAVADAFANDRTLTPEARSMRLRGSALKLAEATASKLDAARAAAQAELDALDQRLNTLPPPDAVSPGLEAEVRARLSAMSERDREAAISKALTDGDTFIVGSVLRGPGFLSGVNKARYDMIRQRFVALAHPQEHARRGRLAAALEDTQRCGGLFMEFVKSAAFNQTATLADAAEKARSAEEAIDRAIAG
ncbi:hypothetical protein FVA81_04180 [Rhizobium sp. WL3]|uniref:hypothetical protein n=1 Tax=Rhizobium sp. WL3 TaxID=2603277 RepID=UPI0011C1DD89|nr:hypothetical protein [Rhizobium sp. WL3]QEE43857.1 hypothetical protein FVA81_04180 [Rhizobium sp. WL3]